MILILIIGALLGAFAVVFAMDNAALVTVNILSWSFTAPLAMVLISATVLGIVIALVAMIPDAVRRSIDERIARRERRRAEMAAARAETAVQAVQHTA